MESHEYFLDLTLRCIVAGIVSGLLTAAVLIALVLLVSSQAPVLSDSENRHKYQADQNVRIHSS